MTDHRAIPVKTVLKNLIGQAVVTQQAKQAVAAEAMTADREFLFTYRFGGKEWGTSVFAADPAEAREKIKAVGLARYDGELMARIPASVPAAGLITRALCWWNNREPR